eukprot:scaffold185596_cov22-Tisochrysis_lutea.AAC.1
MGRGAGAPSWASIDLYRELLSSFSLERREKKAYFIQKEWTWRCVFRKQHAAHPAHHLWHLKGHSRWKEKCPFFPLHVPRT